MHRMVFTAKARGAAHLSSAILQPSARIHSKIAVAPPRTLLCGLLRFRVMTLLLPLTPAAGEQGTQNVCVMTSVERPLAKQLFSQVVAPPAGAQPHPLGEIGALLQRAHGRP